MRFALAICFGMWVCVGNLLTARCGDPKPILIAKGDAVGIPKQPQSAIGANGTIHVVFGDGDKVRYCQSIDGGVSFSSPSLAFQVPNMALGMRRGPRIAICDNVIVVTAIGGKQGKGLDGDILAWNSSDKGVSWTGPNVVNDQVSSAREGLHAMTCDSTGALWCVWLDLRNKRTEIFASKSTDFGIHWNKNMLLYQSPDGNVCECCHPSISVRGDRVTVMFRNSLKGNRDMYIVSSSDSGETFSKATKLGTGEWKLNACPMDGGMIAMDSNAQWAAVWSRKGSVYRSTNESEQEQLLGIGGQPWVTSTQAGTVVVWSNPMERTLHVQMPNDSLPLKLADSAIDPVVVSNPNGDGSVVVFWETKLEGQSAILSIPLIRGAVKP